MQLALPATPKPGEGGSEVEWVRAVSYFLKLRSAVSVEGSDNEGLPAFNRSSYSPQRRRRFVRSHRVIGKIIRMRGR